MRRAAEAVRSAGLRRRCGAEGCGGGAEQRAARTAGESERQRLHKHFAEDMVVDRLPRGTERVSGGRGGGEVCGGLAR